MLFKSFSKRGRDPYCRTLPNEDNSVMNGDGHCGRPCVLSVSKTRCQITTASNMQTGPSFSDKLSKTSCEGFACAQDRMNSAKAFVCSFHLIQLVFCKQQ